MRSILETCQPRKELLDGTFNPEIFTAALSPVIRHYRSQPSAIDRIYSDAEAFFTQATFPTQGLKNTVSNVFRRISGDATARATQRLETAFGGGKTHTLIACTHIAFRGKSIARSVRNILDEKLLPEPGEVNLVGIAGDEIAVSNARGEALIPHTLWGEIAYQIGGESLYREVQEEAESRAAPGKPFLEKVLGGRKVLLMLDELAQYAARLEVAHPHGAEQLSAFLMSLMGFARERHGIAILVTLASSTDAFARQTRYLTQLLNQIVVDPLSEDDAAAIGERAVSGISSIISRDATFETPVQANEIASVLSKRLFAEIDASAAQETAEEYMQLYRRNSTLLPEEAVQEKFRVRMISHYPFHPTLIDFLNQKLSIAENFQGTRGVLRVLAMTVRQIWQQKQAIMMIHASNIDLRDAGIVNEILGRTGSADLMNVLNMDIGSVNTIMQIDGGQSTAERADRMNPHPDGIPFIEHTWKTVFLHSLVGRSQGVSFRLFGLTEPEGIFAVTTPLATPVQVRTALQEINESAFFLRYSDGKYYAHLEPTLNSVLAHIRKSVSRDQINNLMKGTARKLVTDNQVFHIEHDVTSPEDLPDNKERPVLGVVSAATTEVDVEAFIIQKGSNRPRERQNLIFLLVPKTAKVRQEKEQGTIDQLLNAGISEDQQYVEDIARQVAAMRMLEQSPQNYGITPQKLQATDFKQRYSERDQALSIAVSGLYSKLFYPSVTGSLTRKEIRGVSSEGGVSIINLIHDALILDKELLTSKNNTASDLAQLHQLFFEHADPVKVSEIAQNFLCLRRWPVLDSLQTLGQLLRSGVEKGTWILYKMGDMNSPKPTELYSREKPISYGVDLMKGDYSLITSQGALSRGWLVDQRIDPEKIYQLAQETLSQHTVMRVRDIANEIAESLGSIPENIVQNQILNLAKKHSAYVYSGEVDQEKKPKALISGTQADYHLLKPDDVLITPAKAAERGWQVETVRTFELKGLGAAQKFFSVLPRIASQYTRGTAKSIISQLDLSELDLGNGATLRISLSNANPTAIKKLDELLENVAKVSAVTSQSDCYLTIEKPVDGCSLIEELRKS